MRVIVSVQSKRGSSRGLVHYIAHSKVDPEREPEKGRELFNAFGDELSVKSANNSIKADIAPGRASNDELHHLVLSFRPDDYRALGGTEKQRRAALKETTRATMERLERILNADRISWAAAVHCNTENPHVHIAIQKEFLTRDLKTRSMTKILPEALPHFESRDGEKTLTPGLLIEAATEKMDQLITGQRERMPQHDAQQTRHRSESPAHGKTDWETDSDTSQNTKDERDILGQGILAEYELRRIESKVEMLTDHGHKMRFLVSDPVRGKKIRISLQDIRQRRVGSDTNEDASAERQIRAILFKLIGKEDAAKEQIQKDAVDTICKASEIKKLCKKNGWKLPTPSLKKDELDQFQDHYLQASDLRRFSYLEGVRKELERSGEIEPRSDKDIARIAAEKIISEMRTRLHEKSANDFSDRQYYRSVAVGDTRASLAQLDRVENDSGSAVSDFARKVKEAALRLAGRRQDLTAETENDRLRNDILSSLNEQLSEIRKEQKTEKNKVKALEKILTTDPEKTTTEPMYSTEQIAEMETLSLRLKMKENYEKSWREQRSLVDSAGSDSPASRKLLKVDPAADFTRHKDNLVAGRALAREIVARVELDKAKEDLKTFTESKRFQKFAVTDKTTGSVAFLSLHDVDLPSRGSLLDRALRELIEGREHRELRRTVTNLVKGRQQRLKDEVSAAKDIMAFAFRDSVEFKEFSLLGFKSEPMYSPVFTSSEIIAIEMRVSNTKDPKEAARLQPVLETAVDQPSRSLGKILSDFENPQLPTYTPEKERDPSLQRSVDRTEVVAREDQAKTPIRSEKLKEPKSPGHNR